MKPFFNILLEGNIGAGKSTILKKLKNKTFISDHPLSTAEEPVKFWSDAENGNPLSAFLKNKKRLAGAFQALCLTTLDSKKSKPQTNAIVLEERSIHSSNFVFRECLFKNNLLCKETNKMLEISYNLIATKPKHKTTGFIYLKSTPEIVFERIKKRNFKADKLLDKNYISDLHIKHEEWLNNTEVPVYTINADIPITTGQITEAIMWLIQNDKEKNELNSLQGNNSSETE